VAADCFLEGGSGPSTPPVALRAPDGPTKRGSLTTRPTSALSVATDEQDDLVSMVLVGDLDTYTTPDFHEHAQRYDPVEVQLVVDLAEVRLLDSAGLSALVSLRNRAHRGGSRIGLVCPDREMTQLFFFTGLLPAFAFGSDLAGVRAQLARPDGDGPDDLEEP